MIRPQKLFRIISTIGCTGAIIHGRQHITPYTAFAMFFLSHFRPSVIRFYLPIAPKYDHWFFRDRAQNIIAQSISHRTLGLALQQVAFFMVSGVFHACTRRVLSKVEEQSKYKELCRGLNPDPQPFRTMMCRQPQWRRAWLHMILV